MHCLLLLPPASASMPTSHYPVPGILCPVPQLARLDTCVTVVDAATLRANMAGIETVAVSCR